MLAAGISEAAGVAALALVVIVVGGLIWLIARRRLKPGR
jgi:hypothetical protein